MFFKFLLLEKSFLKQDSFKNSLPTFLINILQKWKTVIIAFSVLHYCTSADACESNGIYFTKTIIPWLDLIVRLYVEALGRRIKYILGITPDVGGYSRDFQQHIS